MEYSFSWLDYSSNIKSKNETIYILTSNQTYLYILNEHTRAVNAQRAHLCMLNEHTCVCSMNTLV